MYYIGISHSFETWDYIVAFAIPLWIVVRLLSELAIALADCDIVGGNNE